MNINKFNAELLKCFNHSVFDIRHKLFLKLVPGMAGCKISRIISLAASCLDSDEVYLEVGVLAGHTLLSAANSTKNSVIGIDNFCEFNEYVENKSCLIYNINNYSENNNITFIQGDFFNINLKLDKKIGCFYYDGAHDFESTFKALKIIQEHLSKNSLIIVDDYSLKDVDRAVLEFQKNYPEWYTLFSLKSLTHNLSGNVENLDQQKDDWWLGTSILYKTDEKVKNLAGPKKVSLMGIK